MSATVGMAAKQVSKLDTMKIILTQKPKFSLIQTLNYTRQLLFSQMANQSQSITERLMLLHKWQITSKRLTSL